MAQDSSSIPNFPSSTNLNNPSSPQLNQPNMAQDSISIPNSPNHDDLDFGSPPRPSHPPLLPVNLTREVNIHGSLNHNNNNNNNRNNKNDTNNNNINVDDVDDDDDKEFFKKMRGWLMIVAILAAGSTYQAGLKPPGGFWQDGSEAGNPIMHYEHFNRYLTFFYCNAVSFLSSLVIIILLMKRNFFRNKTKVKVLKFTMLIDLLTFMAAYAAGSSRRISTSIYVVLVMVAVLLCVFFMFLMADYTRDLARHMPFIQRFMRTVPTPARSHSV